MTARKAVRLDCDYPSCRRYRVVVVPPTGGNGLHIARDAVTAVGWSSDPEMNHDWCPNHEE